MPEKTTCGEVVPVILSGGAGTRLWPLSRESFPKQLLPLTSERSLLQETALRLGGRPIVVCNHEHRFIVTDQLREVGLEPRAVTIEPFGRNTAPAAAVAALLLEAEPDALMLVMPSDHTIADPDAFRRAIALAEPLARDGRLVTFGIQPTEANTGYGYIKMGASLAGGYAVERFVEKPDAETARGYVEAGNYLWNAGIFLFSPKALLAEMERLSPAILTGCRAALTEGEHDLSFFRLAEAPFAALVGQSIDYAVMEHTDKAAVVPVDMGWSDVGTWSALWQEGAKDAENNVLSGDVMTLGTSGSYIRSSRRLIAAVGVKDVVVVETDDAILIAGKGHDQEVKAVVDGLKAANRPEALQGSRTYRPWGWFETIDSGERFRVKHILVLPGAKLSLQSHWHRSEHWVVVTGTAIVTRGKEEFLLRENESTFIPAGIAHRLKNPGRLPLRIIEVQSGEYVGEDDIVRIEDDYGRTEG